MKRVSLLVLLLFLLAKTGFSAEGSPNFYTQLIGFKFGGEFFVSSYLSDWSTGVFFENVINPIIGVEIEMVKSAIPVTTYTYLNTDYTGHGERNYIEMGGTLKFYIQNVAIGVGVSYNSFLSGYLVQTNGTYLQMSDKEANYFAAFLGPELTAQISTDLFAKVGIKAIYGIINDNPNYTLGVRFYISFAYGI
jgi:hypothetical protein